MQLPQEVQITTELLWRGTALAAPIDLVLIALLLWLVRRDRYEKIEPWLPWTVGIYYGVLWFWVVLTFWDTVYRYVFADWARWLLPPAQGLFTGLLALLATRLARRIRPVPPVLTVVLVGGAWGVLSHIWAVQRGIVSKPPGLQGASPLGAVVFAFFEFTFYWSAVVLLTLGLRHVWSRARLRPGGRALAAAALVLVLLISGWAMLLKPESPGSPGTLPQDTITVDSMLRTYRYFMPAEKLDAPPILLLLHGSGGDWKQMRWGTGYEFERLAKENGMIVVYPEGFEEHWNDCRARAQFAARRNGIDDVAFLRAIVARLQREVHAGDVVFAAGISNGGHLAYRLALEAPDFVRAVVAFAASLPVDDELDCHPTGRSVPVMVVNGTRDPINPYDGGEVKIYGFASRGHVRSSMQTAEYFARLLPGERGPFVGRLRDRDANANTWVEKRTWQGMNGDEVVLLTVHGGGHTIPQPNARLPRILGPTSRDVDGPREAWQFFLEHGARRPH